MSEPVARMRKLNQFSQFRRTSNNHNNTYRKDLSWLNFDKSRVEERQQVEGQQFYIPVSVTYLTYSSSSLGTQVLLSRMLFQCPYC